tara:strand:- start:34 stop:513 length:480 start_codon:yes stop_codon:yes gene_type:complete
MIEEFRDVKGFEGIYQVSNLGRVKSFKVNKERIKEPCIGTTGYYHTGLIKEGKQHTKKIHQLVAIAFLNHTPCGYSIVVDHIDGDALNNRLDNLQLITNRENSSKDKKGGTSKYTGVCWDKSRGKWMASIRINGKRNTLGRYTDELKAAKAYQKALNAL